ncbi:hypothetical protein [Pseudonocardia sp. TRM90224]|uniref:hypothetical protein n=1 Tax=Pseudonocardia sp. TRM90224 TaxID=2812678 RepID=UPI001E4A6FB9|nr:hypothetical protein [Pseudonocardia sp. TRM90224]
MTAPAQPEENTVRPSYLRVQLRPRREDIPADAMVLPYDRNFDIAIIADRDRQVTDLSRAQTASWHVTDDEISDLAIRQTIFEELLELDIRDYPAANGVDTRVIAHDGNPYVNATLLSLERFTPGDAPHGALVAIPQFSAVILHEVTSRQVLDHLLPFHAMAQSMHDSSDDPCTAEIFWWVDRTYHPVRFEGVDGNSGRVRLPDALKPVFNRLPA